MARMTENAARVLSASRAPANSTMTAAKLAIAAIPHPTLVVVGDTASSISRSGKQETPSDRLSDYLKHLSQGEGLKLDGRNVLPYEQTDTFVEAIAPFIARLS